MGSLTKTHEMPKYFGEVVTNERAEPSSCRKFFGHFCFL